VRAGYNHDIHPTASRSVTLDTTHQDLLWPANNHQSEDRAGL
jgi:hypothetical protein